jgi:SAM-dependent methyltransferase
MPLQGIFDNPEFTWSARPEHIQVGVDLLRSVLVRDGGVLKMVDLGCGAGENTLLTAAGLGEVTVIGVDWALSPLRQASERGLPVAQAVLDGADLPFAAGTFDVVVLSEVIEHLVDTDHALDEAWRVLRPGGVFLVTTPNLAAWFNRILLGFGVQPVFSEVSTRQIFGRPGDIVVGHLRLFTRRALVGFLRERGFEGLRVAGAAFHGVPRPLRFVDRLVSRWPDAAATLLVAATKPKN